MYLYAACVLKLANLWLVEIYLKSQANLNK